MPGLPKPRCNAIMKNGPLKGLKCNRVAMKESLYCKRHNPLVDPTGHWLKTPEAEAGRKEYWARIRKAALEDPTLTSRIHHPRRAPESYERGWKSRRENAKRKKQGLEKLPGFDDVKLMFKANAIINDTKTALPAVPDKPFDQLEPHEQLIVVTGQALDVVHEILKIPFKAVVDGVEKVDLKAASLVKDTAIRTIGLRIKVDTNALAARRADKVLDVLERLKAEAARQVTTIIDNDEDDPPKKKP